MFPLDEVMRKVAISLRKYHSLPFYSKPGDEGLFPIASVKEDNKWVTVRGHHQFFHYPII